MDDETILAQASYSIAQQQACQPVSDRPQSVAKAIAERLANLPDETEARRREAEQEQREQLQAAAERKNLRDRLLSKVGARYRNCTVDTFACDTQAHKDAASKVWAFCETISDQIASGRGVLLYGPPGTGKDHLAVAIMIAALDSTSASVDWVDGAEFYGGVRDNIDGDKSEASFVKRFTTPALLVLSDPLPPLGAIKSEFQLSMLFRVIDRRYRDLKATVVTLNVATREEAEKRLSPNIVDRLAHGAMAIHCNWPSYRRN